VQTDRDAVDAVLNGHRDAYALLVERYGRAVRAVAAQIVKDLHTAEDVAQEAFIKAYENLGRLQNGTAFGAWLLQITRRQALDAIRKRACQVSAEKKLPSVDGARRNGCLEEETARLLDAVMDLREHERNVVLLRHIDGHSVRTISALTGRTVGTVTKQLSRAYARLRTKLTRKR
jgi:RNA polymerase sigma factor (sigma-70 family)